MDLRTEIIEAQKSRAELFKWKLILVATLGSFGLGLAETKATSTFRSDYLFCLIPLVCLYVDLLCSHLNLRMLVIGRYLRLTYLRRTSPATSATSDGGESEAEYEELVEQARAMTVGQPPGDGVMSAYAFEDFAQSYSTFFFCLLVVLWGAFGPVSGLKDGSPFVVSGLFGAVATYLQWDGYARRAKAISALGLPNRN